MKSAESNRRHAARARFLLVFMAPTLALFVSLAGCGRSRDSDDANTVNFLIESMPINLDPRIGTDAQSQHLDGLIFDSLVSHDAQMNIVPDLATSWDTPDPLTYVFHLRRGVKFHDGRAFTSADVKYTFDSILSGAIPSPKRGGFLLIQSIEAIDEATVVFHLHDASASFLWNMDREAFGIVPAGSGASVAQNPIGTGPFRVVSMAQDEEIVVERNPDYFGGAPRVERVRFKVVPEAIVRALELRKGSADIGGVNSLTPDMVLALTKQPGLFAEDQPGTVISYIAFNFDDPILAHREVRQALAYATDRATLIRYLLRSQARAASGLLPPNHWAYEADVQRYAYDPSLAAKLFDTAGFPRGADGVRMHLTLKTSTEESVRLLSEAIAEQWSKVGVALELRPLENATLQADIGRGSFQLYTLRWLGANNDPDIFDLVFNSKRMPPNGFNRGHYDNPALDALIDRQRVEEDREKRKAIVSQIQKIVAVDEPYINLWFNDNVCVHRGRVSGIEMSSGGNYDFLTGAQLK